MSLAKKLIFSLIPVVFLCLAGEGIARLLVPPLDTQLHRENEQIIMALGLPALNEAMISDPILFWRLRPGLKKKLIEGHIADTAIRFTLSTNSLGLRGPEIPRKQGQIRILALGDSTTFGLGVDDDQTWPAVLERLLREKTRRPFEVINAGVPGYTAFQGWRYLKDRGLSLEPDLVLASFGFNDAETWSSRSDFETARILAIHGWERPFLHSRLYAGLKVLFRGKDPAPADPEKRPRLSGREFYSTLREIHEECASRGIPQVLVIWPYALQKHSEDGRLIIAQPLIASLGVEHDVPVANLVESFRPVPGELHLDHLHASPAGCRVAAEALSRACLEAMDRKGGD